MAQEGQFAAGTKEEEAAIRAKRAGACSCAPARCLLLLCCGQK
jgi:hypothetical protein